MRTPLIISLLLILCFGALAQNVGIGTTTPGGKLQVNHRSSTTIPGILMLDSTNTRSGQIRFKNLNSSKYMELWGYAGNYLYSADQFLDIESDSILVATFRGNGNVGINNIFPTDRLDVNGNINLTGVLKVNGSAGNTGQVLTSNGVGDPQWKNVAFANNTRFYLLGSEGATTNTQLNLTTRYNTNTTDIAVGSNSFTVNKSGLYHIEGSADISVSWNPPPASTPSFALSFGDDAIYSTLMQDDMTLDDGVTAYARYSFYRNFSIEIYITAGSVITLLPQLIGTPTGIFGFNFRIQLRGHLISE